MLLARSLVLGLRSRALLAVLLVAMSVAYAVLAGAASSGLREASGTVGPELRDPASVVARPGLAPFPADGVPPGSAILRSQPWAGTVLGTLEPWPHGAAAVPGPYATVPPDFPARSGLTLGPVVAHAGPWDWVLVPPADFARLAPDQAGMATLALAPPGASPLPAPAAGIFLERGAAQVGTMVHLVVGAVALVVALLAGGVMRLELLARERDYATLEALGGRGAARRAAALRTAWIVGLGVALGAAAGWGLAAVGRRALGSDALHVEATWLAEVVVASAAAGVAAGLLGAWGRLRIPVGARLGRRGPAVRRFPGPIRFLLVTPRIAPSAVAAAVVLAGVSSVVLAAAAVPFTILEPQDGTEVLGRAPGNPFRGSADRFLGTHATLFDGINASSPETFAPTMVEGRPVVVRGIDPAGWRNVTGGRLLEGRWPSSMDEATAGLRLARSAGWEVGREVVVPGAYRATARSLAIVGIHASGGLEDDELLATLDAAGDLAGVPPDQVHMLRVRGAPGALAEALRENPVRVTGLAVRPERPIPDTVASARVMVINVGPSEGARALALTVDGVLAGSAVVTVPPRGSLEVAIPFLVPPGENFTLQVNPAVEVQASAADLRIEVPGSVLPHRTFTARVVDALGQPVREAVVETPTGVLATDADGAVEVAAGSPGTVPLTARSGPRTGGVVVFVVDPSWALSPHVAGQHALVVDAAAANATHVRYRVLATLVNLGGAPFAGNVSATLGDAILANATASVPLRGRATVVLDATVPRGTPALEVAGLAVPLPAATEGSAAPEQRPRTVGEVLAAKRAALAEAGAVQPLEGKAFLDDVSAAVEPSAAVIVLATFLHAGAVVVVAVLREVRERNEVLAILRELGAAPEDLVVRGARDALLAVVPGLAAGALLVGAAFALAQPLGFPAAFGHTIPAGTDPWFLVRTVAILALAALLAGAWAAQGRAEEPLRQAPPRPLLDLVEGR